MRSPIDNIVKPHPVLTEYYADEGSRRKRIDRMFNASAQYYDRINSIMSFGSGRWYRDQALRRAGLTLGQRVLDVGAGTGVISLLAQKIVGDGGYVVAVDPSQNMLDIAKANGVKNTYKGLGESLPFADNEFDMVTMGFALRHVSDLRVLFKEYQRVLKPGGKILLLEITRPKNSFARLALKLYLKGYVPIVTRVFLGSAEAQELMKYYWDTIEKCVPPETILGVLEETDMLSVKRNVVLGIFSEYSAVKAK
ncbi:MAG: class I SAM-dependent methyltransferase [Gammaproteobacteria bacterium]|nr:class I SAM-dependent methyltransferase [Gammaproteobacteria bacterium]